jgi:hypothetical protein
LKVATKLRLPEKICWQEFSKTSVIGVVGERWKSISRIAVVLRMPAAGEKRTSQLQIQDQPDLMERKCREIQREVSGAPVSPAISAA